MVLKIKELIPISFSFFGCEISDYCENKFLRGIVCHKFPDFLWKIHQNLKKIHHISLLGF